MALFHSFLWLSSIPFWRRQWQPTPVLLPGKSHGRRSLVGFSLWGREESDTTEWLHFYFSFSCTGEGNGNPLQCSCLENPRAAIYGVAQSQTDWRDLAVAASFWYQMLEISNLVLGKLFFFFGFLKFRLAKTLFTEKAMERHSSTLPGRSHGRRSLVGCSPWGR